MHMCFDARAPGGGLVGPRPVLLPGELQLGFAGKELTFHSTNELLLFPGGPSSLKTQIEINRQRRVGESRLCCFLPSWRKMGPPSPGKGTVAGLSRGGQRRLLVPPCRPGTPGQAPWRPPVSTRLSAASSLPQTPPCSQSGELPTEASSGPGPVKPETQGEEAPK